MNDKHYTPALATAVIIANMVGTGVFTSLGYQLIDLSSGFSLIMLWVLGGIAAFCGAMCYAELGAQLPRSGGEYNFLSVGAHPSLGFVSGWVSATVGFAAPTALVAITFGQYLHKVVPAIQPTAAAVGLISVLAVLHATSRRRSARTQLFFTFIKIVLVILFCLAALVAIQTPTEIKFAPQAGVTSELFSGPFAVSLIYVSYSYSGWNAATYFSDELEHPQTSLPLILLTGSAIVTLLYVLINYTFLKVAPIDAMRGQLDVAYIAADYAFGRSTAVIVSVFLSTLLISTASAMLIAAPRVLQVIGQDFKVFSFMSHTNSEGVPSRAIYIQATFALVLILTASFEAILVFSGFVLAVNTFATVLTLFVLRRKTSASQRPFSAWGYPLTPLLFLGLTGWTLWHIVLNRPIQALYGALCLLAGFIVYFVVNKPQ